MTKATFLTPRITATIGLAAILVAAPFAITQTAGHLSFDLAQAVAKGSDNSGGGSGDGRGGHGSDDAGGDHHGGRGTDDDSASRGTSDDSGTRIEVSGANIEVLHADGTREEIENGRYEMKNAAGRTVEERMATQADIDRLTALR